MRNQPWVRVRRIETPFRLCRKPYKSNPKSLTYQVKFRHYSSSQYTVATLICGKDRWEMHHDVNGRIAQETGVFLKRTSLLVSPETLKTRKKFKGRNS